jgi:hypothetical protein
MTITPIESVLASPLMMFCSRFVVLALFSSVIKKHDDELMAHRHVFLCGCPVALR